MLCATQASFVITYLTGIETAHSQQSTIAGGPLPRSGERLAKRSSDPTSHCFSIDVGHHVHVVDRHSKDSTTLYTSRKSPDSNT